jgi:curved DNA-binding protein CbpA
MAMTTDEALRVLYRRASLHAHPDTGGSTSAMQEVNEAVSVLRGAPAARPAASGSHYPPPEHPPEERIAFGKHRGEYWSDLPLSYVAWLAAESFDNRTRRVAYSWLHWLTRPDV